MAAPWSADELSLLDDAGELRIAIRRGDDTLRAWMPIWVVCAEGQVYVRSWHRRDTGWFGHALRIRRAAVRVPGLAADVIIEDVGESSSELTARVDAAYTAKYGDGGAASMVTPAAAATTLRLDRE
ncbi:MAG: hypothetical protein JWR83_3484 [Aeromicrobium sp.]|nr:hypothetical protein [Aeromicrobium sp.]